jgi:hypothetical protein
MNINSFTFGFEIEGVFSHTLIQDLKKKISVKTKGDGSVQSEDIFGKYNLNDSFLEDVEEINVGIFKKDSELFETLEMIKSKENHFWDSSCGLHFHIKPKRNVEQVKVRIIDMDFLKNIEQFSYANLCKHIKSRKKNKYCIPYKNILASLNDFKHEEKYRFVRVHPQYNTMEFRFFSACEHKCENIRTFLDYFVKELNKVKTVKKNTVELEENNQLIHYKNNHIVDTTKNFIALNINHKINVRVKKGESKIDADYYKDRYSTRLSEETEIDGEEIQDCSEVDCDECSSSDCECNCHA